jgi:hypothetical protein
MAINILIAIVMRHKLLHAILMQKILFSNKRELVSYTQKSSIRENGRPAQGKHLWPVRGNREVHLRAREAAFTGHGMANYGSAIGSALKCIGPLGTLPTKTEKARKSAISKSDMI